MLLIRNINSLEQSEIAFWESTVSSSRKAAVLEKRLERGRKQSILGDILCYKAIAELAGCDIKAIKLGTIGHGKPVCTSHNIFFSISHSGDFVICAAEKSPIGADIERLRSVTQNLINRVCTEKEIESINGSGESFFEVWTAKEAYLKLNGLGVSAGLKSAEVDLDRKTVNCRPYETQSFDGYVYTIVK